MYEVGNILLDTLLKMCLMGMLHIGFICAAWLALRSVNVRLFPRLYLTALLESSFATLTIVYIGIGVV